LTQRIAVAGVRKFDARQKHDVESLYSTPLIDAGRHDVDGNLFLIGLLDERFEQMKKTTGVLQPQERAI
jgi:hypothetical protein